MYYHLLPFFFLLHNQSTRSIVNFKRFPVSKRYQISISSFSGKNQHVTKFTHRELATKSWYRVSKKRILTSSLISVLAMAGAHNASDWKAFRQIMLKHNASTLLTIEIYTYTHTHIIIYLHMYAYKYINILSFIKIKCTNTRNLKDEIIIFFPFSPSNKKMY